MAESTSQAGRTKVLLNTSMGDITVELCDDMPITAGNFRKLVERRNSVLWRNPPPITREKNAFPNVGETEHGYEKALGPKTPPGVRRHAETKCVEIEPEVFRRERFAGKLFDEEGVIMNPSRT